MKKTSVALMLVLGAALCGTAFACDGKMKNKATTTSTSVPASPIIASATPK